MRGMGLEHDHGAFNGRSEVSIVDLAALQEDVRDVSRKLATLTERFNAHAEQEEDRAKKVDARLSELASKISQVPAIPSALLANLFAQSGEGQGPTGTGALVASGVVAFISYVLPRALAWLASRRST